MMKPIIEARAKEQQIRKPADSVPQNSAEQKPIETREVVADMAGVSRDTVRKVEAIKEAAPEIVQAARSGDISINLAAQVAELPEARKTKAATLRERPLLTFVSEAAGACHRLVRSLLPFGSLTGPTSGNRIAIYG